MSKHKDRHSKSVAEKAAARRALERGVWGAIALVAAVILFLWFLLAPETLGQVVVGAVIALLGWINFVAIKAYRGAKLPEWQQPLAKFPLRFAGYGKEGGKPLEAAKGQRGARNMIFMFLGVSVVVVVLLALLMIPELRR